MITLSKSGNSVTFTFDENSGYLQNGTIDVPVNSLSLILDESDMATFRKSASNDIFVSALVGDFGMSKSELEAWYKENMVGSTGGGGDITSGEVQTMIDESISGKADTSAVTQSINAAVSGKIDSESAVTNVKVLTVSQQNEVQIAQSKGDSTASTFVGTVYRVGSGLTWDYQTKEFAVDSSTVALKSEVDAALSGKQDTLIEGRAIDITNNTVSLDLPISAGTGTNSIREGHSGNTASGNYSHAEGNSTSATSNNSHAEGNKTLVSGAVSHAEGSRTSVSGDYSHAEGYYTVANGNSSHAEGGFTVTNGNSSHAEGFYTIADNQSEHASGQYNVSSSASTTFGDSGNTLFSVGNGSDENARHNAFEIRQNGDIYLTKDGVDIKLQDNLGGTVDQTLDTGSTNAVANSAITQAINARPIKGNTIKSYSFGETSGKPFIKFQKGDNSYFSELYYSKINGKSIWGVNNINAIKNLELVEASAITSSVTSASTDSEIPSAKAVYDKFDEVESVTAAALNVLNDKFDGLTLKKLTQAQYDALAPNYDASTLYVIVN